MKYNMNKKITFAIFSLCLTILIGQIIFGIYNNYFSSANKGKIIAKANTYSFFNLVMPSYENLEKIEEFENILPVNTKKDKIEIKSKILELIKERLKPSSQI